MKTLLIYQFGANDVLLEGERSHQNVPACTKRAKLPAPLQITWPATRDNQQNIRLVSGSEQAWAPILGDTLSFLQLAECHEVDLLPIYTNQRVVHPDDTIHYANLIKEIANRWSSVGSGISLALLDPWILMCDPSNQDQVIVEYQAFYDDRYLELVRQSQGRWSRRLIQLSPGTPAMSQALSIFGADPDVKFLYTPRGAGTTTSKLFSANATKKTDQLIEQLMSRLQWGAAANALEAPSNGYTPVDGPHPQRERLQRLRALQAWWDRRYAPAAALLHGDTAPMTTDFVKHCDVLATRPRILDLNLAEARDCLARATVNAHLRHWGEFLLSVVAFRDVYLSWLLRTIDPAARVKSGRVTTLSEKFCGASKMLGTRDRIGVVIQHHRGLVPPVQVDAFLHLDWILRPQALDGLDFGLEELRNRVAHGTATVSSTELEKALKSSGLGTSSSGLALLAKLLDSHSLSPLPIFDLSGMVEHPPGTPGQSVAAQCTSVEAAYRSALGAGDLTAAVLELHRVSSARPHGSGGE